jgi:hypothetical protein
MRKVSKTDVYVLRCLINLGIVLQQLQETTHGLCQVDLDVVVYC